MDNLDIYEDILDHTEKYTKRTLKPAKTMKDIFLALTLAQLTEENIADISFLKEERRFSKVLENYDYKLILKKYKYVDLMNCVLDEFKPTRKEPYKKLSHAAYLAAKYLIRFQDFDHYRKHIALRTNSDEHTLVFLRDFRHTASLPSMFFNKTCLFFQKTGLLDIPVVNQNSKRFMMEEYNYPDNNEEIFLSLVSICHDNHIHGYELNDRLECYYSE